MARQDRKGRASTGPLPDPPPERRASQATGGGVKPRIDGFTAARQKKFFVTLAKTGCISDAAKKAGISRTTVNRWRAKDEEFERKCAAAIDMARQSLDLLAWERAVTGIEEPVIHYGKVVATRRKRSDSIFRLLLTASSPEKYGRQGFVRGGGEARRPAKAVPAPAPAPLAPGQVRRPLKGAALRAALEKRLEEINARLTTDGEWRWVQVPVERAAEAVAMFGGRAGDGPFGKAG